jgi:hypothetical protein
MTAYFIALSTLSLFFEATLQVWFAGKAEENIGFSLASDTEAYTGHLGKARELTNRSVDSAMLADSRENGAIWLANSALREAAYGNFAQARQAAAEALKLTTFRTPTVRLKDIRSHDDRITTGTSQSR